MITKIFSLEDLMEKDSRTVVSVRLPLDCINVLSQVRLSMSDIDELAESVRTKGQLVQGVAAALNPRQAGIYVRELNLVHDADHSIKDLTSVQIDGKRYYIILVAGHRRYNAIRSVLSMPARRGKSFDGRYRANLHFGLSVHNAMSIQFQENRHKKVPALEEADAAFRFWRWQRSQKPKLTMKAFGKSIGRSASWVKSAMRFCSLPEPLQALAASKEVVIPYGILTEAARLAEGMNEIGHSMDDAEITHFVMTAIMRQDTVVLVRKRVTAQLDHVRNGQQNLFNLTSEVPRSVRQVVAPKMISGLYSFTTYLQQLEVLRVRGVLGGNYIEPETNGQGIEMTYSPKSPIKLSAELIDMFSTMLPSLVELAEREGLKTQAEHIADGGSVLEEVAVPLRILSAVEESNVVTS